MEDPDATRPEYWREGPYDLVRPYVGGPEQGPDWSWDSLPEDGAGEPAGDEFPAPPPPPTVGLAGLLAPPGPGDRRARPGRTGRHGRPQRTDRTERVDRTERIDRPNWADGTDENATRLLVGQPAPDQRRRHGKAPRPGPAAPPSGRRRSLAIFAVASVAAAGLALMFVLPSSLTSHKAAPATGGTASAMPSGGRAPSLADGAYGSMSVPASHAAAPSAGASQTAKPVSTMVPSGSSPSPASSVASLSPGSTISLEATTACCRTFSIAHDSGDNQIVITQVTPGSSAAARAEATWVVHPGLANSSCLSFESADTPGDYLMHQDFELFLNANDGSTDFADDATFCVRPGNSGEGYSFESFNRPTLFIRHFDFVAFIASDGGQFPWDASSKWHHDTSWTVIQPWG
jgi:hypothetical protein